jgi:purine-nucleoside phosphorylase
MEASAVLALGEYYGIPAAALMIVSDELSPKKWKTGY